MYQRTYFDKCATIVKGSHINTGLNPVSDLLWGRNSSRFLFYFDHKGLKKKFEDKIYPDLSRLHHRLKITNAGSLDMSELHKVYASQIDAEDKKRATSFDLIFFLIPELWDNGKGFDYTKNYFNTSYYNKQSYDYTLYKLEDGVNWYEARNGYSWKDNIDYVKTKNELFTFYLKSDKKYISGTGDTVTFTYYCECNNNLANTNIEFTDIDNLFKDHCKIGTPLYFTKHGQICYTDEHKRKYCYYVKIPVTFDANPTDKTRKNKFAIQIKIGDKTFKSNIYTVFQEPNTVKHYPQTSDGIYSTETLREELEKFENGQDSIVIGKQHFDIGNENIDLDITDTVNKFINGELVNCGIGVAYAPDIEDSDSINENYIGLLTNKTNSFFEPYIETIYDDFIYDDRSNFILGKKNRLYLYATIGGNLQNLDKLPTCTIEDKEYPVYQATKGIYYTELTLPETAYNAPTMLYDTWDGIVYQGHELEAVELEFTTAPSYPYFNIGTSINEENTFTPCLSGINDNENIKRGEIRRLKLILRENYTKNKAVDNVQNIYTRVYIMDGTAQCDVIPYLPIQRAFSTNYADIDTSILIPNKYYVDVKINYGNEVVDYHDVLHFNIVDDLNNKYE